MTLSQSPSAAPEQINNSKELSTEAQERVNLVANQAIDVLENNPDTNQAVQDLFQKMSLENMRNPENIIKLQQGLYEARDARLASIPSSERLSALKSFSRFMETLTQNIAYMQRDINWSNEANNLKLASTQKTQQVQDTYRRILDQNHPTEIA